MAFDDLMSLVSSQHGSAILGMDKFWTSPIGGVVAGVSRQAACAAADLQPETGSLLPYDLSLEGSKHREGVR